MFQHTAIDVPAHATVPYKNRFAADVCKRQRQTG